MQDGIKKETKRLEGDDFVAAWKATEERKTKMEQ